jgi:hypothetical protein
MVSRACEYCGGIFQSLASEIKRGKGRFCSRACRYASETKSTAQRFFEKVDKNGPVHQHLGTRCWIWTAYADRAGYGRIASPGHGTPSRLASHVSWEIHYGDIPPGKIVCHKCDNPPCVNPEHLFVGTHADNMHDKERKGRANRNNPARGSRQGLAKLTEPEVEYIITQLLVGRTCRSLSEEFSVSKSAVDMIRYRISWKHVLPDITGPIRPL